MKWTSTNTLQTHRLLTPTLTSRHAPSASFIKSIILSSNLAWHLQTCVLHPYSIFVPYWSTFCPPEMSITTTTLRQFFVTYLPTITQQCPVPEALKTPHQALDHAASTGTLTPWWLAERILLHALKDTTLENKHWRAFSLQAHCPISRNGGAHARMCMT